VHSIQHSTLHHSAPCQQTSYNFAMGLTVTIKMIRLSVSFIWKLMAPTHHIYVVFMMGGKLSSKRLISWDPPWIFSDLSDIMGTHFETIWQIPSSHLPIHCEVRFPTGAGNFSLHHRVQNGSGVHTVSYPMGTRGSFPGCKAARVWSWPLTSIQCRG
jgi:hypothetical protein